MAVSEKTTLRHNRWKRQILDIIRSTPNASRIVIKRQTGLSMESILVLVGELLDEGLILSPGTLDDGKVGRRATLLQINPEGCYFIGVRFSAGGISGACVDFGRNTLFDTQREFPSGMTASETLDAIYTCIDSLIARMGDRRGRLRGIGVGAPGVIDLENGVITRYVHIQGWESIPLRQLLAERYGMPVYIEHGVKCTARAVMSAPELSDSRELLFMQMGRGINLCAVTGGRIIHGASYLSGEIGHMHVAGNSRVCECGRAGCLETLAASGALCGMAEQGIDDEDFAVLRSMSHGMGRVRLRTLCAAANAGCAGSAALLRRAGDAIGEALAVSVMLMNPADVILSGGLTASADFREAVEDTLGRRCLPESLRAARLTFMREDALRDALGAAELPMHKEFGVEESGDPAQKALEASL